MSPLANLFTLINQTGLIPVSWLSSTLIPIFKKGDPSLPRNYRPISQLSVIGKLYSKHLFSRLPSWAHLVALPGREQIGFRSGASMVDHTFLLSFLAKKYSVHHGCKLFSVFVDLRGALASRGIDPHLLVLLLRLQIFAGSAFATRAL